MFDLDHRSESTASTQTTPILYIKELGIRYGEFDKLIFEEALRLVDTDGNTIDEVTIAVEKGEPEDDNLLVYQYSHNGDILLRIMSKVIGETLETASEKRKIEEQDISKFIRITADDDEYRIFKVIYDMKERIGSREHFEISRFETAPWILEGANILLLRKFATSNLYGQFHANSIDNDGMIGEAYYLVQRINPVEVEVTRCVGEMTMTTLLTNDGRIIEHRWSDSDLKLESDIPRYASSDWLLGVKQRLDADETQEISEEDPMAHVPSYWQKKEELIAMMKQYMIDHSDVEDMIADFMKNVLFEKPADPIDFADTFFSEFLGIKWKKENDSLSLSSQTEKKTSA